MRKLTSLILLVILLTGCGAPLATPTPTGEATATAQPSPTATPLPPTPTPTALPTPTPTPLPPLPEALFEAKQALDFGNYANAAELFAYAAQDKNLTREQLRLAMIGLGRARAAMGDTDGALTAFEQALIGDPQSDAQVQVFIGDTLLRAGRAAEAVPHYQAFREVYPDLQPYVDTWIGDAAYAAGDYATALTAYLGALDTTTTLSKRLDLREKLALTYGMLGNGDAALEQYDAILSVAQNAGYRAYIMYQAAETALLFGKPAEAYTRMRALLADYPASSYAYQALVKLVNAGEPVNDALRGLVDYYAGAYDAAIAAYQRYLEANPTHNGEPHFYSAQSYLKAGNASAALREFQLLLDTHPNDAYWGGALLGKAQALAALERIEDALAAYRALPDTLPTHHRAAQALREAAQLLVNRGDWARASELYEEMARRYPDDENAPEALFQAGLLAYRVKNLTRAQELWQQLAQRYPSHARAAAARFWLGKSALDSGAVLSGTQSLQALAQEQRWSFYGLRAAEVLSGTAPFTPKGEASSTCEGQDAQRAWESWFASWLGLQAEGLGTLPASLREDERLRRGELLLSVDHFDEGKAELEALRVATTYDALTQYRLALYFREIGLYRSSILAAGTVARLVGQSWESLPPFLGCLMYPRYYAPLIEAEAQRYGVDALLLYALVRQESLFEGQATSSAAAHGLMQVIPGTGAYIAGRLGWPPDYTTGDLYRPMVSVRFGVWYLMQQVQRFDGDVRAALAGYNGGPGNAARWREAAGGDPDLFYEFITLSETRLYVQRITEHYARYQALYGGHE